MPDGCWARKRPKRPKFWTVATGAWNALTPWPARPSMFKTKKCISIRANAPAACCAYRSASIFRWTRENKMSKTRIFLTGVGGQGTLTATNLLAEIAADNGMQVTAGEIHGMAQRGGVVHSFVLIGGFKSPKITEGEADVLLGFEPLESVRALDFVRPGGTIISSLSPVLPLSVCMGRDSYPDIEQIREKCRLCAKDSY